MKTLSAIVLFASLSAAPALATGFSCDGVNRLGQEVAVDAAIIDVGDQEGELLLRLPSGLKEYKGYSDEYRSESGESRVLFAMMLDSQREFTLDLNEAGTEGTLTFPSETIKVTCGGAYQTLGRYSIRAAKAARAYSRLGKDNNALRFTTAAKTALELDSEAKAISGRDLRAALSDCLFVREGAYGEHIGTSAQRKLVEAFERDMRNVAGDEKEVLKFYRSDKLLADSDTLGMPTCSLLMEVDVPGFPTLTNTMALNAVLMD